MQLNRSVAAAFAAAVVACSQVAAQTVDFPPTSSVDEPIAIRVQGLSTGAVVALRTALVDADGRLWTARAEGPME